MLQFENSPNSRYRHCAWCSPWLNHPRRSNPYPACHLRTSWRAVEADFPQQNMPKRKFEANSIKHRGRKLPYFVCYNMLSSTPRMDRHALLCAISDARNGCISHPKSRNGLISACMTSAFLPRIKARQGYCKALLKADSTKLRRRICHSASNDQLKVIPRRHVLCESMTRIDIQKALLSYGGRSERGKLMDKSTSTQYEHGALQTRAPT